MRHDTYESMIGAAILGDDAEKEKQLRRITCKAAASTRMVCGCGSILDQKTVHVLEWKLGKTEGTQSALCPACAANNLETVLNVARDIRSRIGLERTRFFWTTWNKEIPILPEERIVAEDIKTNITVVHVGDR